MSERGSVTVPVLALVSLLVLVAAALAGVGRVVAAHVQATTAADGAALAAAPLTFLPGDPRSEAAVFARANGATLTACRCEVDPGFGRRVARVEVTKVVELPVFGAVTVRARAAAEFDPMDLLAAP